MTDKPEIDEPSGVETTGHEWDGLKELNNPLPRWWVYIFYATILGSIIYMILMPAVPLLHGYTPGILGQSDRRQVAEDVAALRLARAQAGAGLENLSLEQIEANPALLEFAMAAGASAFGDNCATCHGRGAQGARGYPNLRDDDWLWGGTLEDIYTTLRYGVRSGHEQTRISQMPAFGKDGILTAEQISDLVEYVRSLSGGEADKAAVQRAAPVFAEQCSVCHGDQGQGMQAFGAPRLSDRIWLYGSDSDTLRETITNARGGVMPAWQGRLDDITLRALAVYVHSLGGGE